MNIIPRQLTLWIGENELKCKASDLTLSQYTLDFIEDNKDFFKQFILEKSLKNIKVLPIAHNQKALWFLHQINPQNISYNIAIAGKSKTRFNVDFFRRALEVLSERYDMLRCVFANVKYARTPFCQIVMDHVTPFLEDIDATNLTTKQIDDKIYEKYKIPFSLINGPLLKTYIFHNEDFNYFLFNIHHVVCDAWSLKIFIKEFFEIYNALSKGKNPDLEPVTIDYGDFVFDQEELLHGEKGGSQLAYWNEILKGKNSPLILPYDFERPDIQTFNGATFRFSISSNLFVELNKAAMELNVTPNVILFTVYELLLSKLSLQKQFYIGIPFTSRTTKEYENVFGYMINMAAIDCNFEEGKKVSQYVLENKAKLYSAHENQEIPFPVVVESVSPKRDPSRPLVFQVLYNFMNKRILGSLLDLWKPLTDKFRKFGEIEIYPYLINDQEGQFDLTLEILHQIDEFTCVFKYNTDLFKPESVKRFETQYIELLNDLISNPDFQPFWWKQKETDQKSTEINLRTTGTFTIEPISPYLKFWMDKLSFNVNIDFLGYNQVFQQLLNPNSEFNLNYNGFNIALIRLEDIVKSQILENDKIKITQLFEDLLRALSSASEINPKGKYLIVFCPGSDSLQANPEINSFIISWEEKIIEYLNNAKNIYFITSRETIEKYSVDNYYEPLGEEYGHIPYKDDFFISLATLISRKINSFYRLPIKAIAVDCDNTLWKGVVGEDGYMGIKIGRAELAIQRFLVEQYSEGIILCLCSKNNENDVFEVFDKNEEMILKREHITFYRINWQPKSQNLLSLSNEINIGIDSFVFIDDNSSECDEVRSNTPEVITIQKSENDFNANFLRNSWVFDKIKVTDEDKVRSKRYKEESVRAEYRSSVNSYKDFIEGLQIKTDISSFQPNDIPRVSQLTFRTNQFNFTTIRRDESEIKQLSLNPDYDCFQINVTDRFGEYGLTGVIIAKKRKEYFIDTFLLSCRILGKGVEHKLINYIGARAMENKSDIVEIHLIKTKKNVPAQMFLDQNFEDYKHVNDESITYLIPVSVAVDFSFSPVLAKEENYQESSVKGEETKVDISIELRNSFYYLVINNYMELRNIKQELKKFSSIKSDTQKKEDENGALQIVPIITSVWKEVLDRDDIKLTDNFFEIGGHSILIPQIVISLETNYNIKIKIVDIFQYPTIKELSDHIKSNRAGKTTKITERKREKDLKTTDIAVIGLAGRFPGSENIDEFWKTIASGTEEIVFYSREELENKGVDKSLLDQKNYIYASPLLKSADKFDSSFFAFTPREADFMDPQHRLFLEVCYEAIENAGYRQADSEHPIGVFGGCGMNNYLIKNLIHHPETMGPLGEMLTIINNNSDYMTTRVSYKLNFNGPSIDIQTACSTSLVAIHLACQSLVNNDCYIALSGGSFINFPHDEGFLYEPGGIFSPDGHCRPFDKNANGTIFGEGVGVVVLKRLEDAIDDHDTIVSVIKGTAINNDGSHKVGYMAPSVQGQSDVITSALKKAEINPETISYLEAHGTGTKLGDPIEISAITNAYRAYTNKKNYCALGSVKGNIGHLDAAAGIAGIIKTILLLKNRKLPPLTNFTENNPELYLEESPFYINKELQDWETVDHSPRRAGVSSFGIGGTNAHCIIEEAPVIEKHKSKRKFHLLPISAKTPKGLLKQQENLLRYLKGSNEEIADIANTLQQGRESFNHRMLIICEGKEDGILALKDKSPRKVAGDAKLTEPRTVFMFTGQGSQYIRMGRDLYNDFELFRKLIDEAHKVLSEYGIDVLKFIIGEPQDGLDKELNQTFIAQPLLFAIQYSIACLLEEFGIYPDALIGHSIGEVTAACIAGVFSYNEGLKIVAERGRIMQEQKPGSMLSVQLPAELLRPHLIGKTEISLINAPDFSVVSGDFDDIDKLSEKLKSDFPDVFISRLKTSHAFHSYLIEPAVNKFTKQIESFKFNEPQIPVISNISGTWATKEELQDPAYWGKHIRSTVNFVSGINELLKDENTFIIEVGPGNSLSTLLSRYPESKKSHISSTLRHLKEKMNDTDYFLRSIGKAWTSGITIKWSRYYQDEIRFRIPLPTYPFERTRHWINPVVSFIHPDDKNRAVLKPGFDDVNLNNAVIERESSYHDRPLLDNEFRAPESELEKRIVSIWEELLGIKGIGVTDDFFHLGGHSLLAAQVLNRMNEDFDSGISISSFFNSPTISGLVEKGTFEEQIAESKDVTQKLDYTSSLPLSPSQERLWIINQIDNNTPAYNISFSYIFEGELNKIIFQKSLEALFSRHRILHSYIKTENGGPVAYIIQNPEISISELDFSTFSGIGLDDKIQDFIENESRTRFVIEVGPLYRIFLLKLGNEKTLFHFTVHHLVFDGWSWGIFTKELKEIYNDLLTGEQIKLEPLIFNYFEYSMFANLENPDIIHKTSKEFWKNELNGITGQLNFPLDYNRKETSTGNGGRVALSVGKEMTKKLKNYAKGENVTLYMFFLSVYGFLLSRYSGDKDICIGSPTANRPGLKLEKLIGLFINSIVLRLQIDEELSFSDFLKRVKNISIKALSNQDLPFENLVDILQVERILNMNPIFQVMFAWQNAPRPPLDLKGIKPERVFQKNGVSPLDITFYAWEEDGSIFGEIEFCSDILKRSTIDSLAGNFIFLLDKIIENPGIPLKDISIISESNKKKLFVFNNTEVAIPDCLVQNFFENQVTLTPSKTAVISGKSNINYKELNDKSNQLARYLISLGVTGGDVVGICIERSIEMIVSVLGVLKAGCCYLPMDPSFPEDRIKYMYEDSGAKVLISQSSLQDKLGQFTNTSIVLTDSDKSRISEYNPDKPDLKISPQSLAYMIYTSGSTGKPKGVKVHHQAVVNFLNSMLKRPGFSKTDRLLAVTTLSFDISVLEVFLPLSFGAELIIADTEDISDGQKLSALLDLNDITLMQATPATWNILLGSGWKGKKNLKALCGGEAVLPGLVKDLLPKVASLWDMYGPTETTVWSTCNQLTDSAPPILIGTPIDNTRIYILDRNNNQLPVGVIGEVCIGGLGVTKGYNNRPELTAEKFIPFEDSQIIYKTGDFGRFLEDGKIELFGRIDNQIKLRGFRIEPGEIESLLSSLSGVKEAVVKVHKFDENDERLVAFLNVAPEFIMTKEEITGYLSQHLPVYMVPSFFQTLNGFPRLPNGKINKNKLLLEIDESEKKQEIDYDSLTTTQKKLVNIWESILKIKNIALSENFFDTGGNSLLAIRIINKIKEDLGFTLSFKAFITNPTIIQSGNYIDSQTQIVSDNAIELVHLTDTTNLPLTLNQKRLWLVSKLQPDIPSYIIPFTNKFIGSLNRDIFQKSLDILFQRHYILFSVIKEVNGEPFCDIVPSKVNISFTDYSGLPENEKTEKVNEIFKADSRKVFDLQNGPLYRLYLILTGSDEYYFRISIHHIVFDGWSWGVLVKDLNEIYNSLLKGKEVVLDKIEFQQYDFAKWEKSFTGSKHEDELKVFWKENLTGISRILNFPYDFQRREKPSGRAGFETIQLSKELSEKLRRISKKEDSSLFITMLSVFGIQMQKYSGEDDINIGLPIAYRPHSKLENIFGMFVNTVVVRLKYAKEFTFRNIIHQTSEAAMNAIAHQDLPFERVVEIVNPERSSNVNPLFQVGFDWQNNLGKSIQLDNIISESITSKERTSIFDITLYLWENDSQIEGEIEYNIDILKSDTIIRLKDNFIHLLQYVIENPDQAISEISLLSETEKKTLAGFNNTGVSIPDCFIHDFFEKQAGLTPLKKAVISEKANINYKKLNKKSNQLAHHLISLGVKGGDIVGICIERSVEMIVSVMGILKAGCCYLPLDPSFPEDRIKYMYEDSGAKFLISQSSLKSKLDQFINTSIVLTDTDKSKISKCSTGKPDMNISSQSIAYIIYTSGSTGKPKGVKVHHQAVVNFLNSMLKRPGFSKTDRLLAVTTLSFDISVLELFLPLSFGAELIIADTDDISNGQRLSQLLDLYDITLMQATPATWNILLGSRWKGKKNLKALCGGEAILPVLVKELLPKVDSLWDMYGPTETTVWSTCHKLTDSEPPILVGAAIDNTRVYILDKNNIQLPVGVIGEVCIGGLGVTKGYHNRPELTAEKFIPFENGQIIYKTGDLGRFHADGNIELFGRIDNQIKLRGFRIEPGEIENQLSRLSGVREAVVKVHKFDENDERLVAFLNVDTEFKLTKEEIVESLSQQLPGYMIPSFFQKSEGFPRLPNGKINKKALILEIDETNKKNEIDPKLTTITPIELIIYNIWCDILKTKDISTTDNFFDVGGNSLLAISVFSKIESALNVDLGLRVFFDGPRIKDLAETIDISIQKDVNQKSFRKTNGDALIVKGEI